jgi:hypothetical protein
MDNHFHIVIETVDDNLNAGTGVISVYVLLNGLELSQKVAPPRRMVPLFRLVRFVWASGITKSRQALQDKFPHLPKIGVCPSDWKFA